MYKIRTTYSGQIHIEFESVNKPGIDYDIHWLNPRLFICLKQRYPKDLDIG